jgi:hypothetical protein
MTGRVDAEPVALECRGHRLTPRSSHFVGSVKWLESQPFGRREYDALVRDMLAVPGAAADTPLVAVSRCGVSDGLPLAAHWGPDDLVRAWRPR